jgi:putative phosphoesterase
MLIGVISDTHIPERASKMPEMVLKTFEDVDIILHAGDLVSLAVRDELEELAPTTCVMGNMDRYQGLKLPKRKVLVIDGVKIGLDHGEVYPRGDTQQLRYIGLEMGVKFLITGHTHWSFIHEIEDMVLLNPGSPTVPRLSDPTVMLLKIKDNNLDVNIIKIGDSTCKSLNFGKIERRRRVE